MTALDMIVLLIIGVTTVRGLMRGMVDTLFSLLGWFLAFLAGKWGAIMLAPMLPVSMSPNIRYFVAFALVFLGVLISVVLLGHMLASMLKSMGLGGTDKALGGVAGFFKGCMIVIGFTLAAGLTSLPRTQLWQSAALSNALEGAALRVLPFLPEKLAKYIQFT